MAGKYRLGPDMVVSNGTQPEAAHRDEHGAVRGPRAHGGRNVAGGE